MNPWPRSSRNTVPADLLGEKNTVSAEKNKLKSTDYKISEYDQYVKYSSSTSLAYNC